MTDSQPTFSLPPVAVFCEPTRPHPLPCLHADVRPQAARLAACLAAVPAFGTAAERASGLGAATRAAAVLVEAQVAEGAGIDAEALPVRSPVQGYFRVRTTELTAQQAGKEAVLVMQRGLADLCEAPLSGSDITRETAAMRQLVVDLAGAPLDEAAARSREAGKFEDAMVDTVRAPVHRRPEEMWLSRWIIGHQVHVLFNVYATFVLREGVELLRQGAVPEATARLTRATVYVQGFAAARAHAAALPSDFYNTTVRPTMVPTVVSVPLSGSMHMEYRAYRDTLDELLDVLPDSIEDLAPREPQLAFAREALLEADLIEAERHVCLVEPVIGTERSLVQPPATMDNAVSVLRLMRHVRAAKAARLVRFGDHLAAAGTRAQQAGQDSEIHDGQCSN